MTTKDQSPDADGYYLSSDIPLELRPALEETTIRSLHRTAMTFAQKAMVARHGGNDEEARQLARCGSICESLAARQLEPGIANEPTRSILYRSAAWLALQGGSPKRAQQMAQNGLLGWPPMVLEMELLDVLREALAPEVLETKRLTIGKHGNCAHYSIARPCKPLGVCLPSHRVELANEWGCPEWTRLSSPSDESAL